MASSDIKQLSHTLGETKESMAMRFRALFSLRNDVCPESIDAIGKVLLADESELLKHECAYCMGQMRHPYSISYLKKAIQDEAEHPMVRHECGEALAAIGLDDPEIRALLEKYSEHRVPELAETCYLALRKLKYDQENPVKDTPTSDFNAVDPAPPYSNEMSIENLRAIYLDRTQSLWERYRALFSLRNKRTPESLQAICDGLLSKEPDSALLKHEIAFVLGQIQDPDSLSALSKKLADLDENEIVRHECAEAIGSIGETDVIRKYIDDSSRIVRESCQVALDMADYYNTDRFDFMD